MKKGSKKSLLVVVLLLLVGVTAYFGVNTYAKYVSEITGNTGTATVAKWAFRTDNAAQTYTIDLEGTYDSTSLVNGTIAPGTKGSFNIALSTANTDTGVNWTITLDDIANLPTNLKFYKDANRTVAFTPNDSTSTITGQLVPHETRLNVPIYWEWKYETDAVATNDPLDTTDGEAAKTLTIGVTVLGVQTNPTEAVTTHINNN